MNIEQILDDSRYEPDWRSVGAREADYYDGNQLTSDALEELEERGMLPMMRNLIGPAIDVVLGMEERNRQDWKVIADDEPDTDEAIALTHELSQVERLSRADRAVSDAYARQIKVGVGWVEVGRNKDPFGFRHRCFAPRWQEMHWDWRAREPDLSDARYIWRRRWFDVDVLARMFPGKQRVIRRVSKSWAVWDEDPLGDDGEDLARDWETERTSSLEAEEWRDSERERLCLYEVWYRRYEQAQVMRVPQLELVVEFDGENPRHAALVANRLAELETTTLERMRLAYYLGPHKLADRATPYTHNDFPYVPFFGLREDRTGIPYGLIRRMMSPQDEVNSRLTKMHWLLTAKRIIGDSDAFELDEQELLQEAGRPDAYLPLNPKRMNRNAVPKVEADRDLSSQQFQVLQDATKALPELAGVYHAMMGKETTQQSGIAINSLVEQGSTTLAEINGNYVLARKRVGELLLANRINELQDRLFEVTIRRGHERKTVAFNRVVEDAETGVRRLDNALTRLKTRVELTETPASPTYRAHMLNNLMELTKSLSPDQQALIIPMIVETTDLPARDEIARLLRAAVGQGDEDPAAVLRRERDAALAQEAQDLELQERRAKIEEARAKTEETAEKAEKLQAETQQILQQIHITLQQLAAMQVPQGGAAEQRLEPPAEQPAPSAAEDTASMPPGAAPALPPPGQPPGMAP